MLLKIAHLDMQLSSTILCSILDTPVPPARPQGRQESKREEYWPACLYAYFAILLALWGESVFLP